MPTPAHSSCTASDATYSCPTSPDMPAPNRATRGKVQTGSCSVESQSTGADGWHLESYPSGLLNATNGPKRLPRSLNQAHRGLGQEGKEVPLGNRLDGSTGVGRQQLDGRSG
jgi:hypothetical protein